MLKSTSVLSSTFLLSKPSIVCLVWRRVVFLDTPISSKSPSAVSHRPPPLSPITLPPSLCPSSSSPLNFITFGQKGIYSPTKVIAPLMEWASYAIDSLKPCRIFLARKQCFFSLSLDSQSTVSSLFSSVFISLSLDISLHGSSCTFGTYASHRFLSIGVFGSEGRGPGCNLVMEACTQ